MSAKQAFQTRRMKAMASLVRWRSLGSFRAAVDAVIIRECVPGARIQRDPSRHPLISRPLSPSDALAETAGSRKHSGGAGRVREYRLTESGAVPAMIDALGTWGQRGRARRSAQPRRRFLMWSVHHGSLASGCGTARRGQSRSRRAPQTRGPHSYWMVLERPTSSSVSRIPVTE